jgi:hypothetical protein
VRIIEKDSKLFQIRFLRSTSDSRDRFPWVFGQIEGVYSVGLGIGDDSPNDAALDRFQSLVSRLWVSMVGTMSSPRHGCEISMSVIVIVNHFIILTVVPVTEPVSIGFAETEYAHGHLDASNWRNCGEDPQQIHTKDDDDGSLFPFERVSVAAMRTTRRFAAKLSRAFPCTRKGLAGSTLVSGAASSYDGCCKSPPRPCFTRSELAVKADLSGISCTLSG